MLGEFGGADDISAWRAIVHSVLSGIVGLLSWFLAFLAVLGFTRGALYPLIADHDYQNSWGGPTLAGAWAVHALLGVGLFPLWVLLLAGIGWYQVRLLRACRGRGGWWPIPVAVLLAVGGALFFDAWLHQLN